MMSNVTFGVADMPSARPLASILVADVCFEYHHLWHRGAEREIHISNAIVGKYSPLLYWMSFQQHDLTGSK